MYLLRMPGARTITLLAAIAMCLLSLAACGSDSDIESAVASVADSGDDQSEESTSDHDDDSGDHGDEDHDDDDHGEEDHDDDDSDDHGDEDHGEEDHDSDDHGDDDHDDGDHGDEASSGLGAHVHGEAELLVAWSESDVIIDLISPTDNIFGFEYEPTTDDDVALAEERTQALTAPGVLVFNPEAGCSLADDPVTTVVFEGSHAEITASWSFTCDNASEIANLDATPLFTEFPGLVDVDAQWTSDTRQSAAELSASSTVLRFE